MPNVNWNILRTGDMFDNTEFVILSRGRADSVFTLDNLSDEVKSKCYLLVPEGEVIEYSKLGLPVIGRPSWVTGIHQSRQYALDSCLEDNLIMLDDSMCFYNITIEDGKKVMRDNTFDQTNDMFLECIEYLNEVPMTGVSLRQNNSKNSPDYFDYAHRQMNVHCLRTEYFASNNIRFDRLPLMEDFDVTLQLLYMGERNRISHRFAQGKHSRARSNSKGGCSIYRNLELQSECAQKLAEMYPEVVKVVEKKGTSTSFENMKVRKDVRVLWKKAYKTGLELCKTK